MLESWQQPSTLHAGRSSEASHRPPLFYSILQDRACLKSPSESDPKEVSLIVGEVSSCIPVQSLVRICHLDIL